MRGIVNVVTAASDDGLLLATRSEIKTAFGITDTSEDSRIDQYVAQGSAAIATECRRIFASERVTETYRISGSYQTLHLSRYPVATIHSIDEIGTTLEATDYELSPNDGLLRRISSDSYVNWPEGKIVVNYTGGYALPDAAPSDLKLALTSYIRMMRAANSRDPLAKEIDIPGVSRTQYWVGGVGTNGAFPPDVLSILDRFREPSF